MADSLSIAADETATVARGKRGEREPKKASLSRDLNARQQAVRGESEIWLMWIVLALIAGVAVTAFSQYVIESGTDVGKAVGKVLLAITMAAALGLLGWAMLTGHPGNYEGCFGGGRYC